jgi:hypothetical protein
MRLPITLIIAALAIAFAAGPAQAHPADPTRQQASSDSGVAPGAARGFTPPIGSDKGSVTAATPTTPDGIIAILIG